LVVPFISGTKKPLTLVIWRLGHRPGSTLARP
jgi:hypothetical protein